MAIASATFEEQYFTILERASKPGRYIGGEPNMIRKDLETVQVRFALAFPDVYEIGMSHNGLRMLYHLLNGVEDVYAERVFAPWVDMADLMQAEGLPLLSLETKTPIGRFDLVGFSLQSELTYINVPYMLDLAGVPLRSEDRGEGDPLICAGGPCTANPEPLADLVDFFVIGDGEEVVLELVDLCREAKRNGLRRRQTLEQLANLRGVYVPQVHQPEIPWAVESNPAKPRTLVRRRWVEALSPDFYPTRPVVPVIDAIQDRVSVEVMRGCTQGCRFCQAGYWYRPTRELEVNDVMRLTSEMLKNTGNREVGLLSLSTADYSQVECLTREMARSFSRDKVSISLPSLRADAFSVSLAENVGEVRKNGFTFAPEAGSVRLRQFVNKNISNEELFQAIETAYRQGWNLIKLYFMIGLPSETEADIRETVDLIRQIGGIGKRFKGPRKVNASIGTFVPKAFTPFQWDRFEDLKVTTQRLDYLKAKVRFPFARLKWHDPAECFIEGVLSRGDRKVGKALIQAYRLGCRFDGWDETFNFQLWMKAFEQSGVDPHFYNRDIALNEVLPWDFIDIGVSKRFLLTERERSYREIQTYDCKWGDCRGCGIPGNYQDIKLAGIPAEEEKPVDVHWPRADAVNRLGANPASPDPVPSRDAPQEPAPLVQITLPPTAKPPKTAEENKPSGVAALAPSEERLPPRSYLVHYHKEGPARLLSHLNVLKLMERALIRCGVRLKFTEGFNPRPKFTASPAIPLGMSSRSEYLRFEAFGELSGSLAAQLNDCLIEGLEVQAVEAVESGKKKGMTQPLQVSYRAWLPDGAASPAPSEVAELTGRVYDLISHLADRDRGNAFYSNAPEHERIADLRVICEEPLELSFTLSLNPETGSTMKAKNFLGELLDCPETLLSRFRLSKESVSFETSDAASSSASPAAHP